MSAHTKIHGEVSLGFDDLYSSYRFFCIQLVPTEEQKDKAEKRAQWERQCQIAENERLARIQDEALARQRRAYARQKGKK